MARTNTSCYVIKVLANAYPNAFMIQDIKGCAPLHFACTSSCELFGHKIKTLFQLALSHMAIANAVLLQASPELVYWKTTKGWMIFIMHYALMQNLQQSSSSSWLYSKSRRDWRCCSDSEKRDISISGKVWYNIEGPPGKKIVTPRFNACSTSQKEIDKTPDKPYHRLPQKLTGCHCWIMIR